MKLLDVECKSGSNYLFVLQERVKYKTFLETAADLNVVFSWLTSPKASSELTAAVNVAVSNLLEFLDPSVVLDKYWRQLVTILKDHKDPQVSNSIFVFVSMLYFC